MKPKTCKYTDKMVTFDWNSSQSGSGVKPWDCRSGVRDWEETPANIPD